MTVDHHAEWLDAARTVIAQAADTHPACCDWCATCTRCSQKTGAPVDCLTRRMANVTAQLLRIIEANAEATR